MNLTAIHTYHKQWKSLVPAWCCGKHSPITHIIRRLQNNLCRTQPASVDQAHTQPASLDRIFVGENAVFGSGQNHDTMAWYIHCQSLPLLRSALGTGPKNTCWGTEGRTVPTLRKLTDVRLCRVQELQA